MNECDVVEAIRQLTAIVGFVGFLITWALWMQ